MPYELVCKENNKTIDSGHILSPKDLCGLDFIPELINIGVTSFKIEGRLKNPEYVATVTRIYRKYIDLALQTDTYSVNDEDKKSLMQAFNRGGFSSGHLDVKPNKDLIFKEKPSNIGIYIGNVANFNSSKGHITINLNDRIAIGDTVCLENESSKYRISELMINNKNIESAHASQLVTIGRMKGNIKPGDKIFKMESKSLNNISKLSYSSENKKTSLDAIITLKKDLPISMIVSTKDGFNEKVELDVIPSTAINNPITKERIITQISKTGNTPFEFNNINIDLDDNLYINISDLNELRRKSIDTITNTIISSTKKDITNVIPNLELKELHKKQVSKKISILLNIIDINTNYSELKNVDNVYIPLKYFTNQDYANVIKSISSNFNTYIYMPKVIKANYRNLFKTHIDSALTEYDIKGFVLCNLGTINMLDKYKNKYEFIGNYTLNVYNNLSLQNYSNLGLQAITLSPELNKDDITAICETTSINTELIVYGNTPVMTTGYCLLGKSNKCYPNCKSLCRSGNTYYLKDKLGFNFRILPDNVQTINTIYNSKITSIEHSSLNVDSVRIDILDENILEINNIVDVVKSGNRLEGKDFTNGNFVRNV